ncbi:MAG: hypothetical protein HY291_03025 [Planctomycetes bacterium]|nr:hypothetical protein [Planctomycetota bacterium]
MRLTGLPFIMLVLFYGLAHAETGKDAKPSDGEAKPATKDAVAPEGSKTLTGLLCTKADSAPEKILGVLMVKVEKVVKDKPKSKTTTVLLVADGEVGKGLGELLAKQAKVEVTGRNEGDYFRVEGFKLISEGAEDAKNKKNDDAQTGAAKTGDGDDAGAKKKGNNPPAAKHPPKNAKNDPNPKPPSDPVQVAP